MDPVRVQVPASAVAEFCRRHHIRRLSLFGSVLRDDFGPDSDVDVLVEFEPGHTPGLRIIEIEQELSALFGGRRIDMANPRFLNRRLRDRILAEARVQYAEG
ncbi:MAG: nucleotidyltransferase family protein [Deltaproteobacteria bacterium]|nr:nucleotidyltransferase family protein [Deltaproteobacteria bacterium]